MQTETENSPDHPDSGYPPSSQDPPPPALLRWLKAVVVSIAGLGLISLMFVMAGDVIGRFFKYPIPGAYELVEYLMAIIVPFSIAYSAEQKCHVGVDILVEKLSHRNRAIVDSITQLITIILTAIVIWQGWIGFVEAKATTMKSAVLQIPNYPFMLTIPLGFSAFLIFMAVDLHKTVREVNKR